MCNFIKKIFGNSPEQLFCRAPTGDFFLLDLLSQMFSNLYCLLVQQEAKAKNVLLLKVYYSLIKKIATLEFDIQLSKQTCLSRPYPYKFFKGYLPQILLGPFLNTWTHLSHRNLNCDKQLHFSLAHPELNKTEQIKTKKKQIKNSKNPSLIPTLCQQSSEKYSVPVYHFSAKLQEFQYYKPD